jgi:hypothetical protein
MVGKKGKKGICFEKKKAPSIKPWCGANFIMLDFATLPVLW